MSAQLVDTQRASSFCSSRHDGNHVADVVGEAPDIASRLLMRLDDHESDQRRLAGSELEAFRRAHAFLAKGVVRGARRALDQMMRDPVDPDGASVQPLTDREIQLRGQALRQMVRRHAAGG